MASSKEYLNFVLDQCSGLSTRTMMGEYVPYYGGKVVGGIYDNRLLVKPTPSAIALMPEAPHELPSEGAKEMLLVEDIGDRDFLNKLFEAMHEKLPEPKKQSSNLSGRIVQKGLTNHGRPSKFGMQENTECFHTKSRSA